jgi:FtsH-binding integral membrane protein
MYGNRPNNSYPPQGGQPPQYPQQGAYQQYPAYGPVAGQAGYGQPGYGDENTLYVDQRYEGDLSDPAVLAFTKKVYLYFASALATATAAALGGSYAVTQLVAAGNTGAVNGIWMGSLAAFFISYLVVVFSRKSHSPLKTALLYVFATAAGGTLAPVLSIYVAAGMGMAIAYAFGLATVIFFGISVFVLTTGKDFRGLGGYLMVGIFAIIGLWLIGMFTNISGLSTLLMGLGFIVFIGFTFYDTSRVVRDNFYANDAVSPAINLLYDFVMLFRYALYFMGGRD